ncbi:hypothetical protein EGW08_015059, partial [Elysia chlorotica]
NQPSVTSLDIEDNCMGPAGMLCFAEMLKSNAYITEASNDRLLTLKLRMNGSHDEGCRALVGALRYNDTLQELDLGANRVGDEGCKAITRALPYLRLHTLRLSMNPLGMDNADNVLKALLSLEEPSVKEIDFDGVVVGDDFQLLAEELAQRECHVIYRIPPSSRERSRDLPLETLSHVMSFLDDVEMDPLVLFPDPGDGDLILTVQDLFT